MHNSELVLILLVKPYAYECRQPTVKTVIFWDHRLDCNNVNICDRWLTTRSVLFGIVGCGLRISTSLLGGWLRDFSFWVLFPFFCNAAIKAELNVEVNA